VCLAVPARVDTIKGDKALVTAFGCQEVVDIRLLASIDVGDFILIHMGFALEKISADDALFIIQAWQGLMEDGRRRPMKDLWPILTSYRSPQLVHKMVHAIETLVQEKIEIMQVCGTHTWSYRRHGLDSLLPSHLSLLAGPGCPVCVTDQEDIDWVINLAQERQNTLVTFGDIMRGAGKHNLFGRAAESRYGYPDSTFRP